MGGVRGGLLGFVVAFLSAVLVLGRPVGGGQSLLLCLECSGLCGTAGGLLELSVAQQSLECISGLEVHAHLGDVRLCELLDADGTLAGDGGSECADVAQLDFVALQDELSQAYAELREDAYDGALGVHRVVLRDVVGQLGDADDARQLEAGLGLLGVVLVQGMGLHAHAVLNLLHGCSGPLLISSYGCGDTPNGASGVG